MTIDQIAEILLEDATGYNPKFITIVADMSEDNIKRLYREAAQAIVGEFGLHHIDPQLRPAEAIIRRIKSKAMEVLEDGQTILEMCEVMR